MNLVLVVQGKNIKSAVENYEKINTIIKIRMPKKGISSFFENIIFRVSFCGAFKELRSVVSSANPWFLPIFRNLFFLLSKISSPDIDWK